MPAPQEVSSRRPGVTAPRLCRVRARGFLDIGFHRYSATKLTGVSRGYELQDPGRRQVLLVDPYPEGRERVLDRIHHSWRRDDHAALAAEVYVSVKRHGLKVLDLDPRNVTRGRQQVVHERGRLEVAVLVVGRSLKQHGADALRDTAADLALDDRGVDERAAVLGRDVPLHLHQAGLDVHLDDGTVAAARPSAFAAVERGLNLEISAGIGTELPGRGLPGDLGDRDRAVGVAAHHYLAVGDLKVPGAGFHELRREIEHLGLELPGAVQRDAAGHRGRPAAAGQPERHDVT